MSTLLLPRFGVQLCQIWREGAMGAGIWQRWWEQGGSASGSGDVVVPPLTTSARQIWRVWRGLPLENNYYYFPYCHYYDYYPLQNTTTSVWSKQYNTTIQYKLLGRARRALPPAGRRLLLPL